jgi:hypothetical protein
LAPVFVSRVTVRRLRRRCHHLDSLVEELPFRARTNEAKLRRVERLGLRVIERHHVRQLELFLLERTALLLRLVHYLRFARRIEQLSEELLRLNEGTVYAALL